MICKTLPSQRTSQMNRCLLKTSTPWLKRWTTRCRSETQCVKAFNFRGKTARIQSSYSDKCPCQTNSATQKNCFAKWVWRNWALYFAASCPSQIWVSNATWLVQRWRRSLWRVTRFWFGLAVAIAISKTTFRSMLWASASLSGAPCSKSTSLSTRQSSIYSNCTTLMSNWFKTIKRRPLMKSLIYLNSCALWLSRKSSKSISLKNKKVSWTQMLLTELVKRFAY